MTTDERLPAAPDGASAMLEAVGKLVEAAAAAGTDLRLSLRAGDLQISIGSADNAEELGAGGLPFTAAASLAGLGMMHRKLVEKAGAEPIPAKKLIQLAGYEVNSYSRAGVTHLCRLGLLRRTPDGIRRA